MIFLCLASFLLPLYASPIIEDNIYVLTEANFDQFLSENRRVLVEFYAPWCGHCKKLTPQYSKAAEFLATSKSDAFLAKVDATKEPQLAKRFQVQGYPTLKLFVGGSDGQILDYDGGRTAQEIAEWMKEKTDPNYKPPPTSVLILTSENFTDIISNADLILVEFYAPWCGHCKQLAPEYEKAAQRLTAQPNFIPLAKVDATIEKQLKEQYQITGFPTLKIFRKGHSYEYKGPRESDGIVEYMKKQMKDAAVELKSLQEAKKMLSKNDVTIIGFFDKQADYENYVESYKDACQEARDDFPHLFFTFDVEITQHFGTKPGSIGVIYPEIFWSKFESNAVFQENTDSSRQEILDFFQENSIPLVGHRTAANQHTRYTKRPLVVVYYGVDFGYLHRDGTEHWRQKVLAVAHKFSDYTFAVSDEEEFSGELHEVGLSDSGSDVNVVVFSANNRRYKMDPEFYEDFGVDSFTTFMQDMANGRVKKFTKSQPIPKANKAVVRTLVGSNIEGVLSDHTKDVLIEFYAPWCGHCKALEPIYEQLAQKFSGDQNLIIAKLDATANDIPEEFTVEGFPTIYFQQADRRKPPVKYEGGRTLEDLTFFLKQNAAASSDKTEL